MSLSKFSSTRTGKNVFLSNQEQTAKWVGNNDIRGYIVSKNAMPSGTEMTIDVNTKLCTKIVIGFSRSHPSKIENGKPSITGKVYICAKSTTRVVKVKRNDHTLVINFHEMEKKKHCSGDIWIVIGMFYGDGKVTLRNPHTFEDWESFGDVTKAGSSRRLKEWNRDSLVYIYVMSCLRLNIDISSVKKDKCHFVKLSTGMKKLERKHEFFETFEKVAKLEIVYSNGVIQYTCAEIKGLRTVQTDLDGSFVLVFELFNSKLAITECITLEEDCQIVEKTEFVHSRCREAESNCTSSLESNIDLDEDDELEITDQSKFISPPTANNCLLEITNISGFDEQENVCHPNTSKRFLTTNYVKLVKGLMPFPFCDYLVEDSYISIDDQSHIMKLDKNSHPHDVNRHIISLLDKTNIDETKLRLLLKKSDLPHLLEM